ncbi:DUF1289 domain-containing protein [Paracoccus sp. TOH]|uniref:DUF1289 domain-containing protein n=1 Tax=Paracoccus simplex TaxID=2086346 RepID=A0ABV7S1M8_9RHOB|nr:DUF1289 domain-containing protein [Paracoccus sp. TOH]WJS83449.1 DUF1289 domain-containing protein [Paracoccus sp. TOH]
MTVSTPCIKICRIDAESRLCTGCWRFLDEIAAWGGMTEAERLAVMASLPERKARFTSPPSASPA